VYATVCYISLDLLYIHNGDEPSENVLFCLHTWSETLLILRRIKRDIIINVYWSSCKVPRGLVGFE